MTQQPIEQHSKQRSATTIKGLSAAGWAESLFSQLKRIIILTTELWTCKLSISLRLTAAPRAASDPALAAGSVAPRRAEERGEVTRWCGVHGR